MKLTIILILLSLSASAQTRMKGKGVHINSATGKFYTVAVPDTGRTNIPPSPAKIKSFAKKP